MSEVVKEISEYNLNDPRLMDDTPGEYDPQAEQVEISYAPPDDGPQLVKFLLQEQVKEDKPPIYVKGTPGNSRVVVALNPKLIREDGSLGWIRPYWLTSLIARGQTNSSIGFFTLYAGSPLPTAANNGLIKSHVEKLFEVNPEGIDMWAYVQWFLQYKKQTKNGEDVIGKDGYAEYTEVKTQAAVRRWAERQARLAGMERGFNRDELNQSIAEAVSNAHIYIDPVTFEERRIQLDIERLLPPPNVK